MAKSEIKKIIKRKPKPDGALQLFACNVSEEYYAHLKFKEMKGVVTSVAGGGGGGEGGGNVSYCFQRDYNKRLII